jgi:hypothetical protein
MATAVEIPYWIECGVFLLMALLGGLTVWFVSKPTSENKNIKAIFALFYFIIHGVVMASMGLGQGQDTRADGHTTNWERWALYTTDQLLVMTFASCCITAQWMRSLGVGFWNAASFLCLVFGTQSTGDAQQMWFYVCVAVTVLGGIYFCFALFPPVIGGATCDPLPAGRAWAFKLIVLVMRCLAYPVIYLVSSSYLNEFPHAYQEAYTFLALDFASVIIVVAMYVWADPCLDDVIGQVSSFAQNPGDTFLENINRIGAPLPPPATTTPVPTTPVPHPVPPTIAAGVPATAAAASSASKSSKGSPPFIL